MPPAYRRSGRRNCWQRAETASALRSSWRRPRLRAARRSDCWPRRAGGFGRLWLYLDKFIIHGGAPLEGEIAISGAKNSALPALAACLLTAERVTLHRIPPVRDIATMEKLIAHTGARLSRENGAVTVEAGAIKHPEAPYEL